MAIRDSWQPALKRAVAAAAAGLGLRQDSAASIAPRLRCLRLFQQGGCLLAPGQGSGERPAGVFGALEVQLPCCGGHQGGQLVVRHGSSSFQRDSAQVGRGRPRAKASAAEQALAAPAGRCAGCRASSMRPSLTQPPLRRRAWPGVQGGEEDAVTFTARFAACPHELGAISSGRRLVLVYDLAWTSSARPQPSLDDDAAVRALAAAVEAWEAALARDQDEPLQLALPLGGLQRVLLRSAARCAAAPPCTCTRRSAAWAASSHAGCTPGRALAERAYSTGGGDLSFDSLAGADKAVAALIRACPVLEASLVLAVQRKCGSALLLRGSYELAQVSAQPPLLAVRAGRRLHCRWRNARPAALDARPPPPPSLGPAGAASARRVRASSRCRDGLMCRSCLPRRLRRRPRSWSAPTPAGWARMAPA